MSYLRWKSVVAFCFVASPLAGCGGDATTEPVIEEPENGDPAALVFVTDPGDAVAGVAIDPAIRVEVRDSAGNRVDDAELPIALSLAGNPAGAALDGSTTVTSVGGVAIFGGLSIEKAAAGYTLRATAAGLAPATSASQDTLRGTRTVAAVDGAAVFDDLALSLPGSGYVLEAAGGGLEPAASEPFDVRLTFARVNAAGVYTCGVTMAGFAYCWGRNTTGPFGDGTEDPSPTLTPVADGVRFADVGAAGYTCGLALDGAAWCWGDNFQGRLGDGATIDRLTPTRVSGDLTFARISAGFSHTCGITTMDVAYCWGSNSDGQLGDGTTQPRLEPNRVVQ